MGKYCLTLEIYRNIFPFISLLQYRYILQITKFKKDLACFQAEIKKERESLEINCSQTRTVNFFWIQILLFIKF